MATAKIMGQYVRNGTLFVHAEIVGDGYSILDGTTPIAREYVGRIPLELLAGLSSAQQRTVIIAAIKQERDIQRPTSIVPPTLPATLIIPD